MLQASQAASGDYVAGTQQATFSVTNPAPGVTSVAPATVYFADDFENGASQWVTGTGTWGLTTTDFRSGANSISSNPGEAI